MGFLGQVCVCVCVVVCVCVCVCSGQYVLRVGVCFSGLVYFGTGSLSEH